MQKIDVGRISPTDSPNNRKCGDELPQLSTKTLSKEVKKGATIKDCTFFLFLLYKMNVPD